MDFQWHRFLKPVSTRPQPNHLSPDTLRVIQAITEGHRSQIKPMPPTVFRRHR